MNLEKTESIWIGSKLGSNEVLLPQKNLAWNVSGKFKMLGIMFQLFERDKTICNFHDKVNKFKNILNT